MTALYRAAQDLLNMVSGILKEGRGARPLLALAVLAIMVAPGFFLLAPQVEAAAGDIWGVRTSTREVVRLTNASPVPILIPASPRGLDLGSTSYPLRNVKCINMTMTGTYAADDLAAANNLTVGNNLVITGNTTSTGPINSTKTVTVGNLVTSGAGNVGTLTSAGAVNGTVFTASTSTNTVTATATNSHTALANVTALALGVASTFSANATISTTSAALIPVDTTAGARTATVNTSAQAGTTYIFYDSAGTWDTNNFSVNVTSGANINLVNVYTSSTEHGSVRVSADGAGNYHTW